MTVNDDTDERETMIRYVQCKSSEWSVAPSQIIIIISPRKSVQANYNNMLVKTVIDRALIPNFVLYFKINHMIYTKDRAWKH